jgi:hypothetical protein
LVSGPTICGKRSQRIDDAARVVDAERRLGDIGEPRRVAHVERRHVLDGRHQMHLAGIWPIVPSTSGWPAWPISTTSRPESA